MMATCKDCIHYDVCDYWSNTISGICDSFRNKADFVEVEKVAEMFAEQFGDCPCNFNGIDEWLPYVCEHNNVCNCSVEAGWEQFIRHYGERKQNDFKECGNMMRKIRKGDYILITDEYHDRYLEIGKVIEVQNYPHSDDVNFYRVKHVIGCETYTYELEDMCKILMLEK